MQFLNNVILIRKALKEEKKNKNKQAITKALKEEETSMPCQ